MAINSGVNISKANAYAVVSIPAGVNISKANAYAVVSIPAGVNISKASAYAVLQDPNYPVWPVVLTAPDGTVGIAYIFSFTMSGGAAPMTFTVATGSLPAGLTLTGVTGNSGQIAGTPTTAGTYSFTLLATNSTGSASHPLTIVIAGNPQRGNIDYNQIRTAARQGSGGKFQMFGGGSTSPGDIAIYDIGGNVIDGGSLLVMPIRTTAVNYTMSNADYTVVATVPSLTITLPPTPFTGQLAHVKNGNSTTGQLTAVSAAVNIDVSTSISLGATASLHVQFDGTQWRIL